ncbi:NACHT domain-containing protein [Streptomyces sp. NPDC002855]|uniref:NACHT domain-containing protein n=1 Tax=Streptomyces sp. NPDC002855 TaxID=3154437 RepID=UPI00332B1389
MRYWRRGVWVGAALGTGALMAVTVWNRSLEGVGPLLSVLGFLVSLAGLLHTTVRPAVALSPAEQLDRSADALADAVRAQWLAEWRLRRLQDPEPLAVRWAPAQPWLSDLDGAIGWPARDTERPDLSGLLADITQIFGYVPSRRLTVLGPPGSGKTVLAVRFTLDLLEHRGAGDPVPFLLQASSWQPDQQDLRQWMVERLVAGHPALATVGPSGGVLAAELVSCGRVLPVVDGLDELGGQLRTRAVFRLNTELDAGDPLFLTCRSDVYADVVEAGDVLTSAAVVELQPLGFEEAAGYLIRTARPVRGPAGARATAWDPVLEHVRRHPGEAAACCLRQVLELPLMVAMARAVYGESGADPAELLSRRALAEPAAMEQHLLDAFVPASFRTSARWDGDEAMRRLRFLARHLERRGTRDLAWWELHTALPGPLRPLAPLLLLGAVTEIICLAVWLSGQGAESPVVAAAVLTGLCAGYAALARENAGLRRTLLLSVAYVIPLAAIVGATRPLVRDPFYDVPFAGMHELLGRLTVGALYGVAVAAGLGVIGVTTAPAPATMPFPVLRTWRHRRWVWKAAAGIFVAIPAVLITELVIYPVSAPTLLTVAAVSAALGAFAVRGEGATAVEAGGPSRRRYGPGRAGRLGRALVRGVGVGLPAGAVLGLAFALVEGGTAAGRAEARDDLPFRAAVHRPADGGRYVVADDGTRYGLRPDGTAYIRWARPLEGDVIGGCSYYGGEPAFVPLSALSADHPCADATRRASVTAAMEVTAGTAATSAVRVRLPDGRLVATDGVEDRMDEAEWRWIARQDPGQLMRSAVSFGLAGGLGLGVVAGFAAGLHRWLGAPVDTSRTPSPLASLRTDRDTALIRGFLITLVAWLCNLFVAMLPMGAAVATVVVIPMGLVTVALSAWGRLLTARLWCCSTGRLPWRLMAFLAEAHERGVLRQAGAVYQFRHARLQERLASGEGADGR